MNTAGLRLEVRDALLPVDRGDGPAHQPADRWCRRAGTWPASGPAPTATRGVHKAPANEVVLGANGLGLPGHRTTSRAASTRRASTASAPSPAAASASGARARCRATPSGATSTSAGSSTTSPSRSSRARSGRSSSPTTSASGRACASRASNFLTRVWRDGALFGATPEQAFFVKCDAETNPPDVDRGRPGRDRDRHRAGQAGRVRDLPHQPVHRRRRRGLRVAPSSA